MGSIGSMCFLKVSIRGARRGGRKDGSRWGCQGMAGLRRVKGDVGRGWGFMLRARL
jgi:hypothetical protein